MLIKIGLGFEILNLKWKF